MRISQKFLEELKYRTNIGDVISGYVDVKRRGRNLVGLCPFHSEKTPSFVVYDESQSYYCFGCGAGGDAITFVKQIENLDYLEAVKFLADRCGLAMPENEYDDKAERQRSLILEINREAARYYHASLHSPEGKRALDYLKNRGLSEGMIKRFGLGYSPDSWDAATTHLKAKGYAEADIEAAGLMGRGKQGKLYSYFRGRVMFPIIDVRGNVIGFGGRTLTDSGPKYLNSPDTPVFKKSRQLFGLNFAKTTKEKYLILAEGYMDAISMYKAGLDNVVATLGTSLTDDQARLMARYAEEVVVSYDADEAGQKATKRAIDILKQTGLTVRVLRVDGAKDPDEYINKFGADKFKLLLGRSGDSTSYQLDAIKSRFDVNTDEGKVACLKESISVLAGLSSPIERDVYIGKLARDLEVTRMSIEESLKRALKQKQRDKDRRERFGSRGDQADPFDKRNPQRRMDKRAAAAEEMLIAALAQNPEYAPRLKGQVVEEQFSTPLTGRIFTLILEMIDRIGDFDLSVAAAELTDNEVGYLSGIGAKYLPVKLSFDDAKACIDVILEQKEKMNGGSVGKLSDEEFEKYMQSKIGKKR